MRSTETARGVKWIAGVLLLALVLAGCAGEPTLSPEAEIEAEVARVLTLTAQAPRPVYTATPRGEQAAPTPIQVGSGEDEDVFVIPEERPNPLLTQFAPTATLTASPTVPSPTLPPNLAARRGGFVDAARAVAPPVIDGSPEDWDQPAQPITAVVYGGDAHAGGYDLSAEAMLGWDEANLYLFVQVMDERYVQAAAGNQIYRGDSVEILLDADLAGDFDGTSNDEDDYHLGLSLGDELIRPTNYRWQPDDIQGSMPGIVLAGRLTAGGWDMEGTIPWSVFGIQPVEGAVYGMAFSISDNDAAGEMLQESMISTAPNRTLFNPTTWGNLRLVGQP